MSPQDTSVKCAQCGQQIPDELPNGDPAHRKPCPSCGSSARVFSEHGTASSAQSATAEAEIVTYSQNLLSLAQRFIDDGQFNIAVVVAHMACEVAVERSLSETFAQKGLQYLQDPICDFLNGYNLANERVRQLYTALTGDEVHLQPFWSGFTRSVSRRNRIVHRGAGVGKAEAEDSLKATGDLVAHLEK